MVGVAKALAAHLAAGAAVAWLAMLTLGVIRHDVDPDVPPLGYLPLLVIVFAVGSALRFLYHTTIGEAVVSWRTR